MIKMNEESNAQSWELEILCKNKKYLDEVVTAILKYNVINFEVNIIDNRSGPNSFDGRYTVLMWCNWFSTLKNITTDLEKIENRLK